MDRDCLGRPRCTATRCPRSRSTKAGAQPDHVLERIAILELALGKALARCGSAAGYRVLIEYLDDNRAALAEQAHSNLVRREHSPRCR